MDDDYRKMQFGLAKKITRMPSEYIKKNVYVTCESDERISNERSANSMKIAFYSRPIIRISIRNIQDGS